MRRGVQTHTPSRRAVNAFQHGAGRAFAVGAGHMDETEFFLGITRQPGEPARIFQAKMRPKELQALEKFNGFGVSHYIDPSVFKSAAEKK